jgi:hypothetical protein
MNRTLILIVTFLLLAAMALLTQKHAAHSATSTVALAQHRGSHDWTGGKLWSN